MKGDSMTKWHCILLCVIVSLCSCKSGLRRVSQVDESMIMTIRWHRLVNEKGETCDRCGGTQEELRQALESLKTSLGTLGIEIRYEERALSPQECAEDITESNRIWIADRPLEDWINGEVGTSPCGSCCAELDDTVECRTVTVDNMTYEVIPAQLIVKAGLVAASKIMEVPSPEPCCPAGRKTGERDAKCCPQSDQDKEKTAKDSI